MELAYAGNHGTESTTVPVPEGRRRSLRVVPDLRPPLPRRPSRRAVVRAHVWGVPLSRAGRQTDQVKDEAVLDARIAEAVRLLGGL